MRGIAGCWLVSTASLARERGVPAHECVRGAVAMDLVAFRADQRNDAWVLAVHETIACGVRAEQGTRVVVDALDERSVERRHSFFGPRGRDDVADLQVPGQNGRGHRASRRDPTAQIPWFTSSSYVGRAPRPTPPVATIVTSLSATWLAESTALGVVGAPLGRAVALATIRTRPEPGCGRLRTALSSVMVECNPAIEALPIPASKGTANRKSQIFRSDHNGNPEAAVR